MKETSILENQAVAWSPSDKVIARARLTQFMKQTGAAGWDDLYLRSIEDVEKFTDEVLKFFDIKFDPPYEKLLDTSEGIEWSKWCVGGGLNITEMCLDRWIGTEIENQPAIIWEGEEGQTREISYKELKGDVELCAAGLRAHGLKKGDAIGIHLPMMIETTTALLAINRIGAIAVPVFSGYGVEAIATRMNAVKAKAIFVCDGFPRRGKPINTFEVADQAISNCESIKKVFVVSRSYDEDFSEFIDKSKNKDKLIDWTQELIGKGFDNEDKMYLEKTSANDPLIILYSSGTTGRPKGIAHVHCGFPIKAAQDMAFGTDVGRGTRISWVTDIGWMMGPWLIYGALINGATMCLYDGSPDYPNPDRMWEFSAKHKVEILGISPTLIRVLSTRGADTPVRQAKNQESPVQTDSTGNSDEVNFAVSGDADRSVRAPFQKHDLSSLRAFASTGEPWNPAPWYWLFEKVGDSKLPIINYSGGTEISGGILMGNPLLPQKAGSFSAPCLGIDADILGENGESLPAGAVGELAIRKPWIGMARGFWEENERYIETYWSRFEKIWVHCDFAMTDTDGHWYILGRSDDTLNVAGKRVGPAEIESLLVADDRVAEAAVIGVPDEIKGTAMVAFCVLRSAGSLPATNAELEKDASKPESPETPSQSDGEEKHAGRLPALRLEAELKAVVARDMGKPLAPSRIHFVSALPKTRNAKVMRRVIRSAYLGEDAGDLSALENPQTVEEIRQIIK
ncbi:MAG: AMP-binding protein [Pyrinomonadaceae bacterium]|nr:AMP-binding protein [Pyrinomonadaceae bacterium]